MSIIYLTNKELHHIKKLWFSHSITQLNENTQIACPRQNSLDSYHSNQGKVNSSYFCMHHVYYLFDQQGTASH